MSGHLEAAEAVQGIQGINQAVNLQEVADTSAREAERVNLMSSSLEGAVQRAIAAPGEDIHTTSLSYEMTGPGTGDVGKAKADIMSDIQREGVSAPAATEDAPVDKIAERYKALYTEMTNWQVAWSVAQRTQTDTNHLLRGQ